MIVTYEELKNLFGGTSIAEVKINLNKAGVKFIDGKRNRPFTTITSINLAIGINNTNEIQDFMHKDNIEIEIK